MKTASQNALRAAALAAAALLAPALHAQIGPWTDGEILVRSTVQPSGERAIFRIVPETGATAVLTTVQYWGGFSGTMAFDSWRGGLLSNMSMPPDGTFTYRLWLVMHDGTAAAMPGFTGDLKALAPAGDGRVFFIRHTGATQGPQTIEYFDAQDVIQTLKQADGVTPFQADVEHLLYLAPSNALIGCSSAQWAATHCSPVGNSLYRIPLSADGLRVDGPMTCVSLSTSLIYGDLMGLDQLPNGNVLVPTASAFLGAPHGLLSVDPVTLAAGNWAFPQQYDVNGGFWSARLGKAVVHATSGSAWWEPEGLRAFAPGQSDFGAYIPSGLPMLGGGGFSPAENLTEVDLNGPACDGFQIPYGTGLAGKGGHVPLLGAIGCPDIGSLFTISINSVVGGAGGVLFVGLAPAAVPFKGGTFLVGGVAAQVAIAVGGAPGAAGTGSLALPAVLSSPVLAGINLYMQAGFADAAAVKGASLTNGVQFQGN
jgi:hypothetical protein